MCCVFFFLLSVFLDREWMSRDQTKKALINTAKGNLQP